MSIGQGAEKSRSEPYAPLADVGLESDVDDLVGGHGVKDHLRGDVAGGFHWASDAPQALWLGRGR